MYCLGSPPSHARVTQTRTQSFGSGGAMFSAPSSGFFAVFLRQYPTLGNPRPQRDTARWLFPGGGSNPRQRVPLPAPVSLPPREKERNPEFLLSPTAKENASYKTSGKPYHHWAVERERKESELPKVNLCLYRLRIRQRLHYLCVSNGRTNDSLQTFNLLPHVQQHITQRP